MKYGFDFFLLRNSYGGRHSLCGYEVLLAVLSVRQIDSQQDQLPVLRNSLHSESETGDKRTL